MMLYTLFINNSTCFNEYGMFTYGENCSYDNINFNSSELYNTLISFESAYYIVSLMYMFFIKKIIRSDEHYYWLHHIITLFLMNYSFDNNYTKIAGMVILITHYICKIPINLYMMFENSQNVNNNTKNLLTKILINIYGFVIASLWFYCRLFLFGSFLLMSYKFYIITTNGILLIVGSLLLYYINIQWFFSIIEKSINIWNN